MAVQNDPPNFSPDSSEFITACLVAEISKFHLRELLVLGGLFAASEATKNCNFCNGMDVSPLESAVVTAILQGELCAAEVFCLSDQGSVCVTEKGVRIAFHSAQDGRICKSSGESKDPNLLGGLI